MTSSTTLRVIELGNYVIPAYAGMILAEQGADVYKWTDGRDPILANKHGQELWRWINHGKAIVPWHPRALLVDDPWRGMRPDVIIENFRPSTLDRWGIDPAKIARERGVVWVSMRSEVGERSFDLIAQARAWWSFAPWVPFWIGDTAGGLWLAFKALAMAQRRQPGHYILGQASCMAKLVEGELTMDTPRTAEAIPWEHETYRRTQRGAEVEYKGELIVEPVRDRQWQLANLWHKDGRIRI